MHDRTVRWAVVGGVIVCSSVLIYQFIIEPQILQNQMRDCLSRVYNEWDFVNGEDVALKAQDMRRDTCLREFGK